MFAYAGPGSTTYQAKIIAPNGQPLESSSVNFKFTVLNPAADCIVFAETFSSVNMHSSNGLISFSLGTGVKTYPSSSTTFEQVFSNITPSLSCNGVSPATYSPGASDTRKVVMQFHDGSGWQTLPAMSINAVPYAMYANDSDKLGGVSASAYVRKSSVPTCTAGEALFYNGTVFSCVTASGGGGSVTSGSVITALGYTPADGASVTANISSVSATVFSVSSTVNSLSNSVSSLQTSVAASFAAMRSSQWSTSGTTISYVTGNVGIGTATPTVKLSVVDTSTDAYIALSRPANSEGGMAYATGSLPRWMTYVSNQAEVGSNAGSNFGISRYNDAGSFVDVALSITRSNGRVGIGGIYSAVTALDVSGGVRIGIEAATCNASLAGTLRYNSGIVEYCNGAAWVAFGVSGAGIMALNGLASGSQTFALGTAGLTANVSSTGTVHTFNIPLAATSGATAGLVTNTDYNYFTNSIISSTASFTAVATSFTAVTTNQATNAASFASVASNLNTVSSTVNSVSASISSLSNTVAASFAAVSNQWITSGTTLNYNSGNVGIGTTNPSYKLAVSGSTYLKGPVVLGNTPPSGGVLDFGSLVGMGATYKSPLILQDTITDFSSGFTIGNGSSIKLNASSSNTSTTMGSMISLQNVASNTADYGGLVGQYVINENDGSGNVSELSGLNTLVLQNGSGTVFMLSGMSSRAYSYKGNVTNLYGGLFGTANVAGTVGTNYGVMIDSASGNFGTNYGLFVNDQSIIATASQTFNIYSAGLNSVNVFAGRVGVGSTLMPTAKLHIGSGSTTIAALKLTSGSLLASPASGAIEYDGVSLYYTDGTNTRRTIAANAQNGTYDAVSTVANSTGNISIYPNTGTGVVTISATTASTNSQTGALVVKGGMGVAGNTNLAGTLSVTGAVSTAATIAATGYRANQGIPNAADNSTNGYAFGADGDTGMFSPGSGGTNGVLAFYANNGERLRFDINGAGIGTSSPMAQLQVQKPATTSAALMIGGGFAGSPRIQTYGLDADPLGFMGLGTDMAGGPYENSIYFPVGASNGVTTIGSYNGTTYSEKMRIQQNGRVGIGTNSPVATFQVGTISVSSSAFLYAPAVGDPGVIRMTADSTANWIQSGIDASNDSKKDLKFTSINGVSTWMTLQASTGNLGIGVTNPTAKIQVQGNNAPTAYFQSGYGNHFVINAEGDGFGGGAAPLLVSGDPSPSTGWKLIRGIADANGSYLEKFYVDGTGGAYFDGSVSVGSGTMSHKFNVNGEAAFGPNTDWGEKFVVGIDTAKFATGLAYATVGATNGNLHLEPKNSYDTYINHYASGTGRVLIATGNSINGRVGVGTISPNSKFDVAGDMTTRSATLRQTIGDTGASSQWIRLGHLSSPQLGRNTLIHIEAGQGFNGTHLQISSADIRFRTSNGVSVDGNGFCAAASVHVTGHSSLLSAVKIVADAAGCAATAYDIYIYSPPYIGAGSFFTVDTDYNSTWTNTLAIGVADPGAGSDSVLIAPLETITQNTSYFIGNTYFSGGNVGIGGADAAAYTLDVSGTFRVTGQAYTNTGTANFSILSDERYKDIHGSYNRGLNEILKVDTIRFNYKKDNPLGSDPVNEYVGVSAQNLQKAIPEAITEHRENGKDFLTMNTSPVLWTMLNAIKELYAKVMVIFENDQQQSREIASSNARVEKLELENQNLKKENDAVKARLERLEKLLESK
ncbi:hypothetical protein CIK05_05670 [Bdellovibrio sp. qaytius]|nr:hypothetical protein CIK05_05670 [Bdellovibrio sp. qaytius]